MIKSNNLRNAKINKNDEFYTLYEDIEKELKYYKEYFNNKIIYCNCDNPDYSEFFNYFKNNFINLNLKEVIFTFLSNKEDIYATVLTEDENNINEIKEIKLHLNGDGDFRSKECMDILKEVDIVITNPPFSLFREYIDLLFEYKKKFLIIGNYASLLYKNIFPRIMNNELWFGVSPRNMYFKLPDKSLKCVNSCWFTNLNNNKRNSILKLTKEYDQNLYQKYDNYDAIEVNKVINIPNNYNGIMGVPITFLEKYNPDQFEIIGITRKWCKNNEIEQLRLDLNKRDNPYINGKELYTRLLIKHKK